MKTSTKLRSLIVAAIALHSLSADAQVAGTTFTPSPSADRTLTFDITAQGRQLPILWGLDTAWPSEENMRRGVSYIGADNIGVARVSFQPWAEVTDENVLPATLSANLDTRLDIVSLIGKKVDLCLNADAGDNTVAAYKGNPTMWANLMHATAKYAIDKGWKVVTISPFNEPDYDNDWLFLQGTKDDFLEIARQLRQKALVRDNGIRISGGNVLNCDRALEWYNYLKEQLDEGNTHQLAGDFDHYADFFRQVRADGKYATADELHNVMEAMVGVEYGMQTGIWWGTAELARGEFCRASFGERLAYAENRTAWTSAAVYRAPDGKVQAFCGTSERQAQPSSYRFVSTHKDVYYDGHGPQREYVVALPGGYGYQSGQTNAECVVNVIWGEDVQPEVNGTYILMNEYSHKVLSVSGSLDNAAQVVQQSYGNAQSQQWEVAPVPNTIGGDFSYYTIKNAAKPAMKLDVNNWSLDTGGGIIIYDGSTGNNEQWYLRYAGDGYFYIVSRHSNLCIELINSSTADGVKVRQAAIATNRPRQRWRLLPVDADCEATAPDAPANLRATAQSASVALSWDASPSSDVASYTVVRADEGTTDFNTIGRGITATTFLDNTVAQGRRYIYKVKAVDRSLNSSATTAEVVAGPADGKAMIASLTFDGTLADATDNHFDAQTLQDYAFGPGRADEGKALTLNGSSVQLPYALAHLGEMTVAAWVKWSGSQEQQRIFDFGNGADQCIYLTPYDGTGMDFAIVNGGVATHLGCDPLTADSWCHVAVTVGSDAAKLYVNGELKASTTSVAATPAAIAPTLNYIGRSQSDDDPLFVGSVADLRVYNYALTDDEVAGFASSIDAVAADAGRIVATQYFTVAGVRIAEPMPGVTIRRDAHADGSVTTTKLLR